MKTFKNINFTKRDYDCTNIVFCQAENAPDVNWVECEEMSIKLAKCNQLYTSDNVTYFGFI
jgi:hypothetical protein